MRFGVAYTPTERPIRLNYTKLPKYILTDVTKRDPETNKVLESFNYDEVKLWAGTLSLGRPPVIFEGKLDNEQIEKLIRYGSLEDKGQSLTDIIGSSYSEEAIIEGIIVKSKDRLIQVQSYEFDLLNETFQKVHNTRDFYDLLILKLNTFMEGYSLNRISEQVGNSNERYLNGVCDIFNAFCESGNIDESIDPDYLNPPAFGDAGQLNLLLINNKTTLSILEHGNKIHKAIFKIMVSSFRKYKKGSFGLLRENDIQLFNTFVYFINETLNIDLGPAPSFEPKMLKEDYVIKDRMLLKESRSENIVVKEIEKRVSGDVDNMKVIASIQKSFKPTAPQLIKGKEKCVVYLTDPKPFTTDQLKNIQNLNNLYKVPVIIAYVKDGNKMDGNRFRISDDLKKSQVEMVCDDNLDISPAFFKLESWDLMEIFGYCRPRYEPIAIITDETKKSELVLQLYFEEEIMGGRLGVDQNFNIGEMVIEDQLLAARTIEDGNFVNFKELTPPPVWNLFNTISGEYKEWAGIMPSQFEGNNF